MKGPGADSRNSPSPSAHGQVSAPTRGLASAAGETAAGLSALGPSLSGHRTGPCSPRKGDFAEPVPDPSEAYRASVWSLVARARGAGAGEAQTGPLPGQPAPGDRGADVLCKLYVELTTECNLDCRMCIRHVWDEKPTSMPAELFARLVDHIRQMPQVHTLQFGGFGEPTVHPRFFDFLRQAKEADLRTELLTNGAGLDDRALDRLLELELDKLIVSLDSAEANPNDRTFHGQGARQAHHCLRELDRRKAVRGLTRPEVAAVFVATRQNIGQLPALKRLAPQLGFSSILVTNVIPYTPELADEILYANWTTTHCAAAPSRWNPVIDLPRWDAGANTDPIVAQLRSSASHLRVVGADVFGGPMRCRFVTEGCLAVGARGQVAPCLPLLHSHRYWFQGEQRHVQAYRIGDIRETTLEALWNQPDYVAWRHRVRQFQFSPCIACGGCDLRRSNQTDCLGSGFPACGACLWAAGIVQCP